MQSYANSQLQVTRFDRTQGILTATIIVCSMVCVCLFAFWLVYESEVSPTTPRAVGWPSKIQSSSLEEPTPLPVVTPEFPAELRELTPELISVSKVISDLQGSQRLGTQAGVGDSEGDGESGIGGTDRDPEPTPEIVSEHRRWKVHIESENASKYFEHFSFFEIELGAVHKSKNDIVRIKNSGGAWVVKNSSRSEENESQYFVTSNSSASRWDRAVVKQEGFDLSQYILVHFYPDKTLALLRAVEAKALQRQNRKLTDVLTTEFEIVSSDEGFEIQIKAINFRE
jgi:hypothetical protein